MRLDKAQQRRIQETCDALVRLPVVWWAGASWAEKQLVWFVRSSRIAHDLPPELGPTDSLEQQPWADAPAGCALFLARTPGASYRIACGLLMPQGLVLAAAMDDGSADVPAPVRSVLDGIGRELRALVDLVPWPPEGGALPPPPSGSSGPTPLSKWAWLPLPDRRRQR